MSGENDLTIRLKALDGRWETVGSDRLRGIVPESFQATANEWGSDTCSFVLRRSTGAVHPDLTAFTPCRVEIAGVKVWSGRVKETPTQDGQDEAINVQGEGMQYHLDDDVYDAIYVHTRLSDYRDARSFVTADLTNFVTAPSVEASDGGITMAWPKDSNVVVSTVAGAVFDAGPGRTIRRVVAEYEWVGQAGAANFELRVGGADDVSLAAFADPAFSRAYGGTSAGTITDAGSFSTGRRFVLFQFIRITSTLSPAATDLGVRIKAIRAFASTAYESSNASILTADMVVKDAVNQASLLLSTDQSQVAAGTFAIEEYAPGGAQSPREVIASINAYENYDTKVDVEDRIYFQPRPVAPLYEIGEWSGADFSDASTNSGDEIYNRVLVQGTGPDGNPLTITRNSADLASATLAPVSSPSVTNPSFTVDTSSWSGTGMGTLPVLSRTTTAGEFDSAPAALKAVVASSGGNVVGALSGTFTRGLTYTLRLRAKVSSGSARTVYMQLGVAGTDTSAGSGTITTSGFVDMSVSWTPTATRTSGVTISLSFAAPSGEPSGTYFIDTLALYGTTSTLVDRRSFRRAKILPVAMSITTATGTRLGELFLLDHKTTPFRGGFRVVGRGGVRRVLGGGGVHPAWLLRDTGQLIRCAHRADPDTGAWTRVGRMATVTYDHDSQSSTVALDEDREGFEALLSRLALVTG